MEEGRRFIAHSVNEPGVRHELVEHLRAVGELARGFAAPFGAGDAAYALGMAHDLGKFAQDFQNYLMECERGTKRSRGPDHKSAGVAVVLERLKGLGPLLSLVVKGHHGGLGTVEQLMGELNERRRSPQVVEALERAEGLIRELEARGPVQLPACVSRSAHAGELFVRMVFSAVVDADYLDTERHFRGEQPRSWDGRDFELLWEQLKASQTALSGHREDAVSQVRDEVYRACSAAAEKRPGVYRLTVPTGGGKTRSSMAFAVRHALLHGQRQIVVAVPYISITEQTAKVYQEIWEQPEGDTSVVLEHHHAASALRPDANEEDEEGNFDRARIWARLAAENWDAPIVVTTVVELFESLFSRTTSRMRKLHRLANSVIVLDEAQALPPGLLAPILDVLQELTRNYNTTVVLCTATQPAFEQVPEFAKAAPVEIVPDPAPLFRRLSRVRVEWLDELAPQSWERVALLMRHESQVLAIVNTRRDALALRRALDDAELPEEERPLHLSTMLCGAHRRKVLEEVRQRLKDGQPCCLVSTQVVEAGVDFDFPMVLRAMGPLDSIIQAAGRCNREGCRPFGRVIVFQPAEERLPKGPYRVATQAARLVLKGGSRDLDDPDVVGAYFRKTLEFIDPDQHEVQDLRASFDFPEVARKFQVIPPTASVVVPYGDEAARAEVIEGLGMLRRGTPDARHQFRRLQPYLVSLSRGDADRLQRRGKITTVAGDLFEWLGGDRDYDNHWGLTAVAEPPEVDVLLV